MVPKNFPASGDAQFAFVAITLPSPAGDWGYIVLRRAPGGSLCTRMSIPPLGVSGPHRIPGPKVSYLLLGSRRKSKAGKCIPKTPADSWWALGAGRETGKEGG